MDEIGLFYQGIDVDFETHLIRVLRGDRKRIPSTAPVTTSVNCAARCSTVRPLLLALVTAYPPFPAKFHGNLI